MGVTVSVVTLTFLWHVWPGRHWPASAAEEAQFVAELAEAAGARPCGQVSRAHVTSVLNALRCGLTWAELRDCAPGLAPEKLLGAYEKVEAQRAAAVAAWAELVRGPSLPAVATLGPAASRIVPVPVRRLRSAATDPRRTAVIARELDRQVRKVGAVSLRMELTLADYVPGNDDAVRLGRRLYDPYTPGVWGDAYYLPARVGTLTPVRCEYLLAPSAPAEAWAAAEADGEDGVEDVDWDAPAPQVRADRRGRGTAAEEPPAERLRMRRARPPVARRG